MKGVHLSIGNATMQGLAVQLKAREEAASSTERRLEAESRALQQQRQEAELAGMKAQLAVQQQQQQSPLMSPLLQVNPQLGGRSASRLQVCTAITVLIGSVAWTGQVPIMPKSVLFAEDPQPKLCS